jgi:hypothetical protein
LEHAVANLARTSDFLVERGMTPPNEDQIAKMQDRFQDTLSADRERLRALQILRRNGQVNEQVALQAVDWLRTATNASTRRDLLRRMDGLTNAALKEPLLAMLATETSGGVREEMVDVLSDFVTDPAIENKIWELALNDADEDVRDEARDALTEGRMTPERVASLQQRASDPNQPLDARLLALRGLGEADASAPEVIAEFASLAQNSTDPVMRAKLFDAFDEVRDPSLMVPLVYGLQDPSPVVRERAADALGAYGTDERVQQWLRHVAENDADPRVKREAHRALEQSQRAQQRGRREGPPQRF